MKKEMPSPDQWLREAKADPGAAGCGMYLMHNGTVRQTARAKVRHGEQDARPVRGMQFGYDRERLDEVIAQTRAMDGVGYVRVWLNEGELGLGDDIMLVLVGGDIRPHVIDALQYLVGRIKNECVNEQEIFDA
jgi:molybdopterin synthase catalytic subunit